MRRRVVFLAALCMALLTACNSNYSAGEDTAHPYTWTERRDGAIELTIQGAVEEGCSWVVEGDGSGIVQVEQLETDSKGQARFTLAPLASGSSVLSFTCQREGILQERLFQIVMQLQTDEEGNLTIAAANQVEMAGAASAGEDTENPYAWQMEQEGYLNISIAQSAQEGMWRAMGGDDEMISVAGPIYDEGSCEFHVTGRSAGRSALVLYDPDRGYGIRLTLTVEENGQITVSDHQEGPYTPSDEEYPELPQCKALVGAFALPEGVRLRRCGTLDWDGDGTEESCELSFLVNDRDWYCLISKGTSPEEVGAEYAETGQGEVTDVEGCSVTVYRSEDNTTAVWQDSQGRTFLLQYREDTEDGAHAVIRALNGARNG